MKITVIGASGLIGSKLVKLLQQEGHEVVAASLASGVNTLTGEGLAEALTGAQVVVDVTNSPSLEDQAALEFFTTSGRHIVAAAGKAGVKHHVALSVVGTERLQESGYFRGKLAQENLIKESPIPYTILRSTQFFEFLGGIAQSKTDGQTVSLSPALVQPIAADEAAATLADVAVNPPLNSTIEVAGPERFSLAELVQCYLTKTGDARRVRVDANARYFGARLDEQTLTPGANPRLGATNFERWFRTFKPKP